MKLIASSSYLPNKIVMNKELSEKLGVTEEFIEKRTGIKQRYLAENETIEEMEIKATEKLIEKTKTFVVDLTPMKIIENSCAYFGSSYQGRFLGTKNLIGISHKAPIIIEESREIIFFPTNSPRIYECAWISLKNLQNYKKGKDN